MARAFLICVVPALLALCATAALLPLTAAQRQLSAAASVDLTSARHAVSQGIYGVNGLPTAAMTHSIGSTRMGGGDPTTVYNWSTASPRTHTKSDNTPLIACTHLLHFHSPFCVSTCTLPGASMRTMQG